MKTYQTIARLLGNIKRCNKANNQEWADRHQERIDDILQRFPHGSGFDSGTELDQAKSTPEKLMFKTSYHHMNEGGYYDGWTDHVIIVKPSLQYGFNMTVSGRNKRDIKDYIVEMFEEVLNTDLD